jgi:threonine/homoserine/homoserine lactone efflux protein
LDAEKWERRRTAQISKGTQGQKTYGVGELFNGYGAGILTTHPLLEGIFFGLLLSVMIGPVFFALIQTSVQHGFEQGLSVAFGASLSDILIMSGCFWGIVNVSVDEPATKFIGMMGTLVLFITGLHMIRKPFMGIEKQVNLQTNGNIVKNFTKGFLVNSLNPFVFVYWMGIVGFTSAKYNFEIIKISKFTGGMALTIVTTDLLKVYLASRAKSVINVSHVKKISAVIGIIFIAYSLQLFMQIFTG